MLAAFWLVLYFVIILVTTSVALACAELYEKKIRHLNLSILDSSMRRAAASLGVLIAFLASASLPLFYEFPKDISGRSVATITKSGEIIYHPYGRMTPPWKWAGENVVEMIGINSHISNISQVIRNQNGEIGRLDVAAFLFTTDVETYIINVNRLEYPRDVVWHARGWALEYLIDHAAHIKAVNVKDEYVAATICGDLLKDLNQKLVGYGVESKDCRLTFVPQANW